jgi:fucose permease
MHAAPHRQVAALDGIAFAGMFVFGIVMALLGAVMPVLSTRLSLGLDDVGMLFLVTNGAMLATSIVVGPAMDRYGIKTPLAAGGFLVALALLLLVNASRFRELLPAVACLGVGGGALNASTNTLVADLHDDPVRKAAALNILGVFFGFGALILPFSIGALLSRVGITMLLLATAVLCASTGVIAVLLRFPAAKQGHGWPLADVGQFVRQPFVLTLACLLFFQSGNEFILGGYFATFLTHQLSVSIGTASYLLAAYWGAIMASRVLLSRVLPRFGPHRIVMTGAVLAAAGALAVAGSRTLDLAVIGIVVTGLALAGIFPTVLGVAGAAFREHSGTVFGILFTAALTGGMTMPWIAGNLAARSGLRTVFALAAVNFTAIAVLSAVSRRLSPAASRERAALTR